MAYSWKRKLYTSMCCILVITCLVMWIDEFNNSKTIKILESRYLLHERPLISKLTTEDRHIMPF